MGRPPARHPRAPSTGYPDWLESTLHITPGRDPLGFQTITPDRIIPRLVPGVLALSRRARYLSFYAFVLAYYREQLLPASNNALSDFLKRREFELPSRSSSARRGAERSQWRPWAATRP